MNENNQLMAVQQGKGSTAVDVYDPHMHGQKEVEDEVDLRALWRVILRYRKVIALILCVFVISALLISLLLRPMYQAVVSIEVNTSGRNLVKFQNVESQDLGTREYIQTQTKIINSDAVAMEVIRRLDLLNNPEFNGRLNQRGVVNGLRSIVSIFKSSAPVNESAGMQRSLARYKERLSIDPVRNTSLINVLFESFTPELASKIANAHAEAYIYLSDKRRFNSTSGAKEFLEGEIEVIQSKLETSEKQLNDFARQNGVIDVEDRNNIMMERLAELNRSLSEVQAERIDAQTKDVQAKLGGGEYLGNVYEDPLIERLREEQAGLKAEYFELSKVYKPKYPVMQQLDAKISDIEASIQSQVETVVGGIEANYEQLKLRESLLKSELETLKTELLNLQDRAVTYNILKREWEANKELYSGLLERTKEVGIAAGMELNVASVIDEAAVPQRKSSPNIGLNIFIAMILGGGLGIGFAFLLALLDNTVNDVEGLQQLTQVGHLGVSPKVTLDGDLNVDDDAERKRIVDMLVYHDPANTFSESIQSVRTSLSYARAGGFPKTIMLTSSLAGEGKSTVGINLAISSANAGKKVIVIEADLRRSRLYKVFGVPSSPGLSDYLVGSGDAKPYKIDVVPNLSVLVGGSKTPNPVDLLGSAEMRNLIAECEKEYDLVVVDCPPVLMLADAIVVSRMVEAVLFVVRAHQTPKDAIKGSVQRLRSVGAPLIGTLLNDVQAKNSAYDYDYSYTYKLDSGEVS